MANRGKQKPGKEAAADRAALLKKAFLKIESLDAQLAEARRAREEPIAIVGMACRFPGGANDPTAFWQLLESGTDPIGDAPPERWNVEDYLDSDRDAVGKAYTLKGGFIDDVDHFDAAFFGISPREAQQMDPQQRWLLQTAWQALEDAGIAPESLFGSRTGVFVGMTGSDFLFLQTGNDSRNIDTYLASGTSHAIAAGRVSYALGLRGPAMTIDTACSSALLAVHQACQSLRIGECDIGLAGGVLLMLSADGFVSACKAQLLSPDGHCKTFDDSADGYARAEGCAMVALKRLSDAQRDGDRILAVIRGSASNQDGRSGGLTAPSGKAQEAVIKQALANARIAPEEVSFVETHGTGTSLGDPIEVQALAAVYSDGRAKDRPLVIGSVKSNIGHTEGVAGVAGLIKLVLALQQEKIPGNLHFNKPNSHIPWQDYSLVVADRLIEWPATAQRKIGGVSSFGFSGTNVHMLVEQAPAAVAVVNEVERPAHVLTLSARREAGVDELAGTYAEALEKGDDVSVADFCYTANTGRSHFEYRMAVVGAGKSQLLAGLRAAQGEERDRVFRGGKVQPHSPYPVAFLFAGETSAFVGMGRDLFQSQPTVRDILTACDRLLKDRLEYPLLAAMIPESEEVDRTLLDQASYGQPALFALQWALVEFWRSLGVTPTVVLGHGCGEIAAACTAGILEFEAGLRIAAERGRQFDECFEPGTMVEVLGDGGQVRNILGDQGTVRIAAANAPRNLIVGGAADEMRVATEKLRAAGFECRELTADRAYQSQALTKASAPIVALANEFDHRRPFVDFVSALNGKVADGALPITPDYWGRQVSGELRMADALRAVRSRGCRAMVEIGPRGSILAMARRHLPGFSTQWLPSLRAGRDDWQQLLSSVASLYVAGMDIDWQGIDTGFSRRKIELPGYPFDRQVFAIKSSAPARPVHDIGSYPHPLVGRPLDSPRIAGRVWESRLDETSDPFVDFRCHECRVVPATACLEAMLTAGRLANPERDPAIADFVFRRSLSLQAGVVVQIAISDPASESCEVEIYEAGSAAVGSGADWARLADAMLVPREGDASVAAPENVREEWRERCSEAIRSAEFYELLTDNGYTCGPEYRPVRSLRRRDGELVAELGIPDGNAGDSPPAGLLEACSQLVLAARPGMAALRPGMAPAVLQSLESAWLDRDLPAVLHAHATIRDPAEGRQNAGDVQLFDTEGRLLGELTGIRHGALDRDAIPVVQQRRLDQWLYGVDWQSKTLPRAAPAAGSRRHWLLFADEGGCASAVAQLLEDRKESVAVVTPGGGTAKTGENRHTANPDEIDSVVDLLKTISTTDPGAALSIVYFGCLDLAGLDAASGDPAKNAATACVRVVNVVRALAAIEPSIKAGLTLVTRGAQPVSQSTLSVEPAQAPFTGLARVLANEHPELAARIVDLDPDVDARKGAGALLPALIAEDDGDRQIALRGANAFVPRLVRSNEGQGVDPEGRLEPGRGASLVTGGLGGIGLTVAAWLAENGAGRIYLMGRSPASPEARERIAGLEAAGASISILQADVADAAQLQEALATIDANGDELRGVFHAAGVLDDAMLMQQDLRSFEKVLRPKLNGSWNLHTLTADRELDFFVLFSAAAALFGNPGQGNYAAANVFLDVLAHHRRSCGLPALSINWGAWGQVGMAAALGSRAHDRWATLGVGEIDPLDGVDAMARAILNGSAQLAIVPIHWKQWLRAIPGNRPPPFTSLLATSAGTEALGDPSVSELRSRLADGGPGRDDCLGEYLTQRLADLLGLVAADIDPKQPVSDLGFDSLMATNLKTRIEADLGVDVPVSALLDGPNAHDLVDRLLAVFDASHSTPGVPGDREDGPDWEEGVL